MEFVLYALISPMYFLCMGFILTLFLVISINLFHLPFCLFMNDSYIMLAVKCHGQSAGVMARHEEHLLLL